MIYHEYIDPAQAKPGDFLCAEYTGFYDLHLLVKALSIEGKERNNWFFVIRFDGRQYKDEIIDGKPTPALIARFTGNSGKRFEATFGETWVKMANGVFSVSDVRSNKYGTDSKAAWFFVLFPNESEARRIDVRNGTLEENIKEAEDKRARLIAWLEEV